MRITNRMMMDNAVQNMADNLERINKLQKKLSTTKQFQNASEDPEHASANLSLRSHLQTLESFTDAAENAHNWMTASDSSLDQIEQIATRANTLILNGLTDSISVEAKFTLSSEIQDLVNQAFEIGNTSVNGQYIFAGFQVNNKAFSLTDSPTTLTDSLGHTFTPKVINYLGDSGSIQRSLGPDQSVALNINGNQAILGLIQNLILASNALMQNNIHKTGNAATDPLTLEAALGGVKSSMDGIDQERTSNGARLRQVESAASFLESVKIETKSLISANEDTNMAEGIALLANQQTTYEAVLEVSQRAISALSLFDYLR